MDWLTSVRQVIPNSRQSQVVIPNSAASYCVNRDTLFCYHSASEEFLHRIMALYVASHYKNTPNDLQLLSDAPAHLIFVLLGPIDPTSTTLPDVLCVLQVPTNQNTVPWLLTNQNHVFLAAMATNFDWSCMCSAHFGNLRIFETVTQFINFQNVQRNFKIVQISKMRRTYVTQF